MITTKVNHSHKNIPTEVKEDIKQNVCCIFQKKGIKEPEEIKPKAKEVNDDDVGKV